ncbi:MAG: class I SAM-dependent methyltransferase [Thermaerobacter sp.]|nr:class I SAM-dependent methyltransferase [Thermaerobacter sp.]
MGEQDDVAFVRDRFRENAKYFDREPVLIAALGFRRLRRFVAAEAQGVTLEVAVGTGLNLPYYPRGIALTGIDLSPEMLSYAAARARQLGIPVNLLEGDAAALPFPDQSFDTVIETFSGCTFPDPVAAYREMRRVLRPGGQLLLAEHGRGDRSLVGRLLDRFAPGHYRSTACHLNRSPLDLVKAAGWQPQVLHRGAAGVLIALRATV